MSILNLAQFLNNLCGALEIRPKCSRGVGSVGMANEKYFSLVLIRQVALSHQAFP